MNPKKIEIADFNYILPENRIAKFPLETRDASKLLYFDGACIVDKQFSGLSEILEASDCLVFNRSRVIKARLFFQTETGALIELFCLEAASGNPEDLHAKGSVQWACLIGNKKKWKENSSLTMSSGPFELKASFIGPLRDFFIVEFSWSPSNSSFQDILAHFGKLPLPPYLKRDAEDSDLERYQTMYAKEEGSVAAPTAGLHFSEKVMASLHQKGIKTGSLLLHVGAGTFLPVKEKEIGNHQMHEEYIQVSLELIDQLLQCEGRIIPVGTTSMRSLESIYLLGCKLASGYSFQSVFNISQWEYLDLSHALTSKESLQNVKAYMQQNNLQILIGSTELMITPGYSIKSCDGLITNFHQPSSTLLLLISAIVGDNWRTIYEHALSNNYRFLSYGDSSILFPPKPTKGTK